MINSIFIFYLMHVAVVRIRSLRGSLGGHLLSHINL